MMGTLRFYARGTAQVTDPHAAERGIRRCVGRRWQEVQPGRWSWVPTDKLDECEYHHDLAKACRKGDLWPADEETATALNVAFDPTFGGEVTESIKDWKSKAAPEKSDAAKTPTKGDDAKHASSK